MIYHNGTFLLPDEFRINPDDRGLLLGDGIFETMRVYEGRVFCLHAHYERMAHGAGILKIPVPVTAGAFETAILELIGKNGLDNKNATIRVTLTRGPGLRGLLPPANIQPTLMITATPFSAQAQKPLTLHICKQTRRNEQSPLSQIKSLCYLDNILARMEAIENHADDAILLNTKGHIASASAANIFMVSDKGVIITPTIEEGVLPGITRHTIISICKDNNIPLVEKSVTIEELNTAKEVFISNSVIEIQAVFSIDGRVIDTGEAGGITTKLQNAYQETVAPLPLS